MKYKILIVDDEPGIRDFLRTFFQEKGYEVITVGDGESALSLIKKEDPHLMLLDLKMPSMDGEDVLKQAIRLKRDLKVVIITAMEDRKMRRYARRLGVLGYILKPFSLTYLHEVIAQGMPQSPEEDTLD